MSAPNRRQWLLHGGAALAAAAWLRPARACEFHATTLRITHPWTRASLPGETTAVVGMRLDEVTQDDRLVEVRTPVAETAAIVSPGQSPSAAGVDLPIRAGQELVLGEDGPQLLLLGLRLPLDVARTYPLMLRFEHGGRVLATLNVDYVRFR